MTRRPAPTLAVALLSTLAATAAPAAERVVLAEYFTNLY